MCTRVYRFNIATKSVNESACELRKKRKMRMRRGAAASEQVRGVLFA